MKCLLNVPSDKCDQIEDESGPFSYSKADCNTIPVHISKKGSKLSVGNLARLLKQIQETSQSTSERYGRNLAMLANDQRV